MTMPFRLSELDNGDLIYEVEVENEIYKTKDHDDIYETSIEDFIKAVNDVEDDDEVIFATWAPNPSKLDYRQHKNYKSHVYTLFFDMQQYADKFCVTPELTVNGNIHYHMWLVFRDTFKWYRYIMPRLKSRGMLRVKKCRKGTFKGGNYPYAYHMKDIYEMSEILFPYRIPYTHNNYRNIRNVIKYDIYHSKELEKDKRGILLYV